MCIRRISFLPTRQTPNGTPSPLALGERWSEGSLVKDLLEFRSHVRRRVGEIRPKLVLLAVDFCALCKDFIELFIHYLHTAGAEQFVEQEATEQTEVRNQ